jgi:lactate dehydrogenase-like 2-hydroxyacid dehydrogenase
MTRIGLLQAGPMMPFVTEQFSPTFDVHRLWEATDPDVLLEKIGADVQAIATGAQTAVDARLMERLPNLKIVANFGVGYDSVDARWAGEHGIIVTNTPDVLTEEVADTTLGLLLMTVRHLGAAERYLRAGKWPQAPYPLTPSLRGRTVGILGFGRIGKAIARRVEACGIPVVYCGRRRQDDVTQPYYDSLLAMARDVDTLIVAVPGGAETHHMVNAQVLEALGPNGVLINIGRGSVVDEAALISALQERKILSAGLDVFEDEPNVPQALIDMEHVVLLPHVGSASVHTRQAMGQLVVDNLKAFAAGKPPLTPVTETPFKGW